MDARFEKALSELNKQLADSPSLGGLLKVDFGEPGSILIDGTNGPNTVTSGAGRSADCTVTLSLDTLKALRDRRIDPTVAFMQGKLRVTGDLGLALKLGPVLQSAQG